ncbi:Luciferin 4-monooxygenase [Habropoda laboriosa]|uniref:Luciferin 4-monooxygenase n=1 Tax=Habropoda laboriosa TaxID=597456 RepID=A0A0L7QUX4_9HYME|nr:PREDICTED: 4-coumarate--CoA ligase 1-like [Habropoda laboriosa]KOC62438.1 Luciferin 4-monooxygenase [Habropoda laboriosa]
MKIQNNIIHGGPIDVPNISVGQHLLEHLHANAHRILQIDAETGKQFTYNDILKKSTTLATVLKNDGIAIEDRISTATENHPNFVVAMCSTLFIGATFTPLNPVYTEREYRHMLEIFQPRVIFVSQRTEKLLAKIVSTLNWTTKLISLDDKTSDKNIVTLKELLEKSNDTANSCTFVATPIDDSAKKTSAILCSSGTTGLPKGVMLSHRNLLLFIKNMRIVIDIQQGDRAILFLPMFHGYAFGLINLVICAGAAICTMRSFEIEKFLRLTEKYRITHLPLVPPILVTLAKHPTVTNYDYGSVRQVLCGAAPLPKNVADEVKRRMKVKHIRNGYGMTELSIITNISDGTTSDDTVGPIVPGFKCKVVDTTSGKILAPGEIGEICFAGEQLMLGYYKNPKTTAETIDKENWLHTGDLGYFNEEGLLYITGRIKELIKYKGYQVSPSEIESVILKHPSVKDAAVMGIPDELSGELPMALVVRQPGSNISSKEIVDFTNSYLSPQKRLRGGVKFVASIPKTPSGKIVRRELPILSKL